MINRADAFMQAILSLQHEKDRALAAAQTERGNVNKLQAEYEEMQTANAALKSYLSTAEDQAANSERLLQASSKEAQQFQDSMVEKIKVNFGLADFWPSMSEQHAHLRCIDMR